jgi:hypothetical protein
LGRFAGELAVGQPGRERGGLGRHVYLYSTV